MTWKYNILNKCVKCGFINATSKYIQILDVEYIRRRCYNCGYVWIEDTLDSEDNNG